MEISGSGSLDAASVRRCTIEIEGVVQGVGFRPHVYRTAVRHGLAGSVRNSLRGALVEVEGDENSLRRFFEEVTASLAAAARRPRVTVRWDAPRGAGDTFSIGGSARDGEARLFPSPDLAVCDTCLGELSDPCDRRHGYALLTCAECGPRFTMVAALPYDRERTTMGDFAMCARCRREYEDPDDRRFHAEGTACSTCGPRLTLHGTDGALVPTADPIGLAAGALRAGGILAVKGVGGYHLACDAAAGPVVAALRRRKRREAKPLARLTRTGVLEALGTDYARTARAKGLPERAVVRHALRNALLPVVTVIGGRAGMLFTGAVLVETVFAWPGLGQLMLSSILTRDIPVLLGLFVLVSLAVIVANLLTDLAYAWLDPRVRYE